MASRTVCIRCHASDALAARWSRPHERASRKDACPDCGKPKYKASRRCQRCFADEAFVKATLGKTPYRSTSLERILEAEFRKRRLKFETQRWMLGTRPDFVFDSARLIVEADGDYWHRIRKKDHSRLANAAIADNWTVWRFAESEIRMHPAACGRAVARFVRDHSPKQKARLSAGLDASSD